MMNTQIQIQPVATVENKLTRLVQNLAEFPQVEMPVTHRFTPGLYAREIFMPKGTLVVSKIHKTEHPYVVSKGEAAVWCEADGMKRIKAPFTGITKPGTQRILLILEDCIWTTFHPTTETDLEKIEAAIIQPPIAPFELNPEVLKQLQSFKEEDK
jgi:hypothetical protein